MKPTREKENEKKHGIGIGVISGISVIYLVLGLAMLFVPKIKEVYIVYMICAVLIAFGILTIVRYFTDGRFLDPGEYGFSGGVLAVIAGFCILIRSSQVAESFGLFLGICILLTAVIKLQNAADLNAMKNRSWPIFLILALVFLVLAVLVILDLFSWREKQMNIIYVILAADGAVGLFSTIYMMIASRLYWKEPKKTLKKQDAESLKEESEGADGSGFGENENTDIPEPVHQIEETDVSQTDEPTETSGQAENDFPSDEEILKAVFPETSDSSKK